MLLVAQAPARRAVWKRASLILPYLDQLLAETDVATRLRNDPLELPHRYQAPADVEIAALLSSALAYGRVDLFKPRLEELLASLGPSPARTASDSTAAQLLERTSSFSYRMTSGRDVACLLLGAGRLLSDHGSLGARFGAHYQRLGGGPQRLGGGPQRLGGGPQRLGGGPQRLGGETIRAALGAFVDDLYAPDFRALTGAREPSRRLKHLLPHPGRGSACKRLNLFLRWMVRGPDGVDLGLWREVPPRALVIPLDTHVHRIGSFIGLTRRKDLSWRTAEEITAHLRHLDPEDPVRFDFALSHLGISGACPSRRDERKCAGCPLQPICRHWT